MENHPFSPTENKPISKITIQTYMRSVRAFLGFLYTEGYLQDDFRRSFKLPKAPSKTIEILSEDEISALLKSMNDKTELGLRNKCIVALMLDSGLRRNEVLGLKVSDIHLNQDCIKVFGKGEKERIVPIAVYTRKLLQNYMLKFRSFPEYNAQALFLAKDRKGLTKEGLKEVFARLKKRTGILRLHPHLLRHTFGTRYIMNNGDMFTLQQILGHSDLGIVRKYVHLAGYFAVDVHKNRSTLDRMCRENII